MPRARQGARLPNPAANRTDLAGKVPVMTQPGQDYGKQTAQAQSQRIQPLGGTPGPTLAAQAAAAGANPNAQQPSPVQAPQGTAGPTLDWLRPTERPQEPTTAGIDGGPGPGSQVLQGVGALARASMNTDGNLKSLLSYLASRPGASSTVKALAQGQ
jgi:hypothetical protein